jgi:hypothetical protein
MSKHQPQDEETWFREHLSAIYIFGLFAFGLLTATSGIWLESETGAIPFGRWNAYCGKLLIELSIASIAGAIATVFLSLRDVREHISSIIAKLFSEGRIAGLLSREARTLLDHEIVHRRLGSEVTHIDDGLLRQLTELSDQCLKSVHLHDYHIDKSFGRHPKNPSLIYECTAINFEVQIGHLKTPVDFQYGMGYEILLPSEAEISDEDFLIGFSLRFGEEEFSRDSCTIVRLTRECGYAVRFEFNKSFRLESDTPVRLAYRAALLEPDTVTMWTARYPTFGLRVSLNYSSDWDYACKWFTSLKAKPGDWFDGGEIQQLDRGICATTHGWVLPGEGLVINWTQKKVPAETP